MKRAFLLTSALLIFILLLTGCGKKEVAQPDPTPEAAAPAADTADEPTEPVQSATWADLVFVTGTAKRTTLGEEGGGMTFTLKDANTYTYRFQEGVTYEDVTVEADVSNLGDNDNGFSLICRASDDGWYEFRASSGGLYNLFVYDAAMKERGENPYKTLDSGGSGLMTSKNTHLKFMCQGNTLRMFANGEEIEPTKGTIEDNTYTSGKIGVGAMSNARTPVKISFDQVTATGTE